MIILDNDEYREMTPEEEQKYFENQFQPSIEGKISELKQKLADTDYKAIKFAEGWISKEDYEPIKAERQEIRNQINNLGG